jgi:hypothetical protein
MEILNVCLPALVHTFCPVLASRIGRAGFVPYRLAASITLPDRRNCRSWGFGAGVVRGHAACKIIERSVPDLKPSGRELFSRTLFSDLG